MVVSKPWSKKNAYKETSNKILTKLAQLHLKNQTFNALILDGDTRNTTRHLQKTFGERVNITIIEDNIDTHSLHIKNKMESHNMKHYEFFNKNTTKKYAFIYMDLCGTIKKHGNFNHMFDNSFVNDISIVGVTFCRRSTIKGTKFEREFVEWNKRFIESAKFNDYSCTTMNDSYKYRNDGSNMQTTFYVFKKIISIE